MTILIKRMVLDRCITMMLTKENDKCDFAQEEVIKTMIKTKTKTKIMTKTNTFREHIQRVILETCDL